MYYRNILFLKLLYKIIFNPVLLNVIFLGKFSKEIPIDEYCVYMK